MLRVLGTFALVAFLTASRATPASAQFTLTGGSSTILGVYLSAGRILRIAPTTTLTLGATYTDVLRLEPLISFTTTYPVGRGWNAVFTSSYGGIGGDYRIDRLPEISFTTGDRVPGTALTYTLDLGIGNYTVRPAAASGYRLHAVAQLSTPSLALGPVVRTSAALGYRQNFYTTNVHGAWWGTVQFTVAPWPNFSTTLTYFRQVPSGSSPLLFDGISQENSLSAGVTFRVTQAVTFTHSQAYSFLTSSISARVYGASLALQGGQMVAVSWDDVPRTLSLSYSRSGFGSLNVTWEVPIEKVTLSFSR